MIKIYLDKLKLKQKPHKLIENIIEEFKFKIPSSLSSVSGFILKFNKMDFHSLFFESIKIVTGPSLDNSICIFAPKSPVFTFWPIA